MRITNAWREKNAPYSEDVVRVETDDGMYSLTAAQIEQVLIEDGQMCEDCHDIGVVEVMETLWGGEPHQARMHRPCPCKKGKPKP